MGEENVFIIVFVDLHDLEWGSINSKWYKSDIQKKNLY